MDNSLNKVISICIPTYRRRALLAEAVDSCLAQTYSDFEIVIGDDSPDDDSERLIAEYERSHPGRFRYMRHTPSLGQNENVNDLFTRAQGGRLLLLHDDDLLLPTALAGMAQLWENLPTLDAAFGKQILIEHDGQPTANERTLSLNSAYYRVAANSGRQAIPVVAGLSRMFPNDGYLVSSELARKIGYRSIAEVGHACDTDFGIRLCAAASDVWFLDEYTMQYRLTKESISKYSVVAPYTYKLLKALRVPSAAEPMLDAAKRNIAPNAVSDLAKMGEPGRAWTIFRSVDYPSHLRTSPKGLYHLLLILSSFLRQIVGKNPKKQF